MLSLKKKSQSPDSETKRRQIQASMDFVMARRIRMSAKKEKHVKYMLEATPLR